MALLTTSQATAVSLEVNPGSPAGRQGPGFALLGSNLPLNSMAVPTADV